MRAGDFNLQMTPNEVTFWESFPSLRSTSPLSFDHLDITESYSQKSSSSAAISSPINVTAAVQLLPLMQIRGSTIRYIHFPDHVDLSGIIQAGIQRERDAANKYQRGVRKVRKAPPWKRDSSLSSLFICHFVPAIAELGRGVIVITGIICTPTLCGWLLRFGLLLFW